MAGGPVAELASRARPEVMRAVTSFVGRETELDTARHLLADSRLLTLTGAGGIGKTRLALELGAAVSSQFPEGVWVVELGGLRADDDVAEAVVATLGLATATSTQDALTQLYEALADARLLLVLDNCEHLLPAVRPVVDALLRATAHVVVLATSREPLGIGGERVVGIAPLRVPTADQAPDVDTARGYPAVRLLEDRATAASNGFVLDRHNLADVVAIVARLDGLPLAIELAAVRLRSLSAADLLQRIGDRFTMLNRGNETALPQHRTLRAMVEWSLDLCTPSERVLWGRMSVFAGGCDLNAVLSVCDHDVPVGAVLDDLDSLVAKSVVTVEKIDGTTRYRLLETLAELGREQLVAAGDTDAVQGRHAAHYRRLAHLAAGRFWSRDQEAAVRGFVVDRLNLQQAFEHLLTHRVDDGRGALELAADTRVFWIGLSMLREGRRWLDAALAAAPEQDPVRASALFAAMWIASLQGDEAAAQARIAEADTFVAGLGEPGVANKIAMWKAVGSICTHADDAGVAELGRCAEWFLAAGDAEGATVSLEMMSIGQALLGRHDHARATSERFLRLTLDNEDTWGRSYALWTRAHAAWSRGDVVEAVSASRQSLAVKYEFGDRYGSATVLGVLAGVCRDTGDPARAATLLGIASVVWGAVGTGYKSLGAALGGTYLAVGDAARRDLGVEAYAAAFERGRDLSPDRARAFALERLQERSVETPVAQVAQGAAVGAAETDGLSRREVEVASLVATGLSNRGIADRLVLSHRTVEGHVERILAKLGFRNRVEIAAWVVAGGDATPAGARMHDAGDVDG